MEENKNSAIEKAESLTVKGIDNERKRELNAEEKRAEKQKKLNEKQMELQIKQDRLKAIQAEKNRLERQRILERQADKERLYEERKEKRELKYKERKEKRKENKGRGGWIAAVVSLSVAVLVLGTLLTLTFFTPIDEYMSYDTREQQSFYDLVGYVDSMDVNLSKLVVSNDDEEQQRLLGDIRVESNLATSSISQMSLQDEDKYYTTKFINQVGDFCKYLNDKMIKGEKLTGEDKQTLQSIYNIIANLKKTLNELSQRIDENFEFSSLYEDKDDNLLISEFADLEKGAMEYPHMIYDGAFSDAKNSDTAIALQGEKEIKKTDAITKYKEYFKNYNMKEVEITGETSSKQIASYNVVGTDENGITLQAQISKLGGKLILFNYFKECENDVYDLATCEEYADKFLENLGFKNMKAVWATEGNHTATFNYASVVDGVICYTDLIKVNVCKERGVISGLESSSYYLNHKEREKQTAEITVETARKRVNGELQIASERLAIIPVGEQKEVLAYEFVGIYDDATYYVYINAKTGKEVDIFRVIESTEGTLLM